MEYNKQKKNSLSAYSHSDVLSSDTVQCGRWTPEFRRGINAAIFTVFKTFTCSWCDITSVATSLRHEQTRNLVRLPTREEIFLLHSAQTGSGYLPASSSINIRNSFPPDNAA